MHLPQHGADSYCVLQEFNVFAKFFDSPWFTIILIFTAALQCFMVEVGGDFVGTNGLEWRGWLITIAIGALALPVGFLTRLINVDSLEAKYGQLSDEEFQEELDELEEEENEALALADEGNKSPKVAQSPPPAAAPAEEAKPLPAPTPVEPLEVKTEN